MGDGKKSAGGATSSGMNKQAGTGEDMGLTDWQDVSMEDDMGRSSLSVKTFAIGLLILTSSLSSNRFKLYHTPTLKSTFYETL
jgi:hypothetical protein